MRNIRILKFSIIMFRVSTVCAFCLNVGGKTCEHRCEFELRFSITTCPIYCLVLFSGLLDHKRRPCPKKNVRKRLIAQAIYTVRVTLKLT